MAKDIQKIPLKNIANLDSNELLLKIFELCMNGTLDQPSVNVLKQFLYLALKREGYDQ